MQILSSEQIRLWDLFTIENEPITSLDLMERAAFKCLEWLQNNKYLTSTFVIFCGKGNNGGDGLALARMLNEKHCITTVYILQHARETEDFHTNLGRLQNTSVALFTIQSEEDIPPIAPDSVVVDALFGSGLNRPLESLMAGLIEHINQSGNEVISIDIPSGMYTDKSSKHGSIVKASYTLSFQCYKLAFLIPENEQYFGYLHILDIGLSAIFLDGIETDFTLIEENVIKSIYKPRKAFSHKGSFGHALLIAGSYGKMGAAVLSAKACLRTGTGLLSCLIPSCGYEIMQISVPEAMVITDANNHYISSVAVELAKYNAIGIGPGLGSEKVTKEALEHLIRIFDKPMVIDADGLNIIAHKTELLSAVPQFSILTPHPKEFERLFGYCSNDFARLEMARKRAMELKLVIILKGHHTVIAMPGGNCYFNSTGNPGMATGGSGDVLTGMLTGLLAQGYHSEQAALLGVYLHGLAGDFAARRKSQEALIASDITDHLGDGFKKFSAYIKTEDTNKNLA